MVVLVIVLNSDWEIIFLYLFCPQQFPFVTIYLFYNIEKIIFRTTNMTTQKALMRKIFEIPNTFRQETILINQCCMKKGWGG